MTDDAIDPQQLLNEAVEFHQAKRLIEAESNYLLLLEHLPHVPEINNLYALLLTETGRSEDAIPYLKVTSAADPTDENLLRYAMICLKHDHHNEALEALSKLLETHPDHLEAHLLHARALQAKGHQHDALIEFSDLLAKKPDSPMILHHMGQCLHQYQITDYSDTMADVFTTMMGHPDVQPQRLFHNAVALILKHPALAQYLSAPAQDMATSLPSLQSLLTSKLFSILLDECLIVNKEIEHLLTRLRAYFLKSLSHPDGREIIADNADLICHMANQCFFNEYVYSLDESPQGHPSQISILGGDPSPEMAQFNKGLIGLSACYDALYETDLADRAAKLAPQLNDAAFSRLIRIQITEPMIEADLAKNMPALGSIADEVSQKVQALYEQSPYPRWRHYSNITPRTFLDDLSRQLPNFSAEKLSFTDTPDILIAGGGTGQHPLMTARTIKGATVTSIDLSRRSLSYAQRKAQEMKVANISFKQADILELEKLGHQYDVVESVGVIHHMADPIHALVKLNDRLKPGGYMKIGLYSKAARAAFNLARDKISEMGIKDDLDSIRHFRKMAFDLPKSNPVSEITKAQDFYSLSTCRDLLFHVQEHQFTIPEIEKALGDLGLEFLGFTFSTPDQHKAFKQLHPMKGQESKLENWATFEEKAPNCFGAMYVFWVRKAA